MKFSIKDFFSKCNQIRSFLRIRSHLLKKCLMENLIFCAVLGMNEMQFFRADILSKTGILMKLTKNLVTIVSGLWIRCSVKKIICEHSHWCDTLVPLLTYVPILMNPSLVPLPLNVNVVIECPLTCRKKSRLVIKIISIFPPILCDLGY